MITFEEARAVAQRAGFSVREYGSEDASSFSLVRVFEPDDGGVVMLVDKNTGVLTLDSYVSDMAKWKSRLSAMTPVGVGHP